MNFLQRTYAMYATIHVIIICNHANMDCQSSADFHLGLVHGTLLVPIHAENNKSDHKQGRMQTHQQWSHK